MRYVVLQKSRQSIMDNVLSQELFLHEFRKVRTTPEQYPIGTLKFLKKNPTLISGRFMTTLNKFAW